MKDTTQSIRPYLDLGEHVLWTGRPRQGIVFREGDIFIIPFSVLFGGAAVSELSKFLRKTQTGGSTISHALLLIPAMAIALYLVFGRLVVDAYHGSKLVYAITDRRVIILDSALRNSVTWIELRSLEKQKLVEHEEGRGTIHFGPISKNDTLRLHAGMTENPTFFQIKNARNVYELLRKALQDIK
jgi:hypothetical protein